MRFLRILFAGVLIRTVRQIFLTEVVLDIAAHHVDSVLAQVGGVSTHVGDVTRFIQTLGHHHGFLHAVTQTRTRRLLKR
ncbi:Uncharacterised protein [Enterobacter cloacae]|nr:Uncharacterised protein [Enterobacter cloacae]